MLQIGVLFLQRLQIEAVARAAVPNGQRRTPGRPIGVVVVRKGNEYLVLAHIGRADGIGKGKCLVAALRGRGRKKGGAEEVGLVARGKHLQRGIDRRERGVIQKTHIGAAGELHARDALRDKYGAVDGDDGRAVKGIGNDDALRAPLYDAAYGIPLPLFVVLVRERAYAAPLTAVTVICHIIYAERSAYGAHRQRDGSDGDARKEAYARRIQRGAQHARQRQRVPADPHAGGGRRLHDGRRAQRCICRNGRNGGGNDGVCDQRGLRITETEIGHARKSQKRRPDQRGQRGEQKPWKGRALDRHAHDRRRVGGDAQRRGRN